MFPFFKFRLTISLRDSVTRFHDTFIGPHKIHEPKIKKKGVNIIKPVVDIIAMALKPTLTKKDKNNKKDRCFNLTYGNKTTPANNNYTIRLDGCDSAKMTTKLDPANLRVYGRSLFEIASTSTADD